MTRLLIVEDDPSIAQSLREGLERHGFDVDHTISGRDDRRHGRDSDDD